MSIKEIYEKKYEANRLQAAAAIEAIGGQAETARKITDILFEDDLIKRPLQIGSVWAWVNRDKCGIPIEYLEYVERLSGVNRKLLRQDIPWP